MNLKHRGDLGKVFLLVVLFPWPQVSAAAQMNTRRYSEERAAHYADVSKLPRELVSAIITVESGWNPRALSRKGAAGLMQLMPKTARRFGVLDRFDVDQNIRGGTAYLAWLMALFKGDLRLSVAAYLVGESTILLHGLAYSSREAFEYVSRVARIYRAERAAIRAAIDARSISRGDR